MMRIRNGLLLSILSLLLACQQNPIIMSTTTSLDLGDGTGFNADTNYDTFLSSAVGTQTQLTFSNSDGDSVQFLINSTATGTIQLANIPQFIVTFGSLSGLALMPTTGYLTITKSSGTGANVTTFSGGFQFNLKSATDTTTTTTPTATGTIIGSFNYQKPSS